MTESSCEFLLQSLPKISEAEYLRSTFIANRPLNNFLTYTAVSLNIVTIYAIRKTSSLPKTLKTLLLSLAVSDVGVGLFAQPFYTSLLVKWLKENNPGCNTNMAFSIVTSLFCQASFFIVVAVSVDRFLALHLHLRYQEHVTHKRVVAVVISIWALSALSSLMMLWVPNNIRSVLLTFGTVGFLLTSVVYIRIYFIVRRHKDQIRALQVQQEPQIREMANFASLVKSAVGVFYVYLVFLACYLPNLFCFAAIKIYGPSTDLKIVWLFTWTLVFLNSSLNPLIYCWKMKHIRHAIMDMLRSISWSRNRTSHQS
ncbi:adenosine receptor A2a-like [Oculina patagonica]